MRLARMRVMSSVPNASSYRLWGHDLVRGTRLADEYEVLNVLGSGGMSVVVGVQRLSDDALFALKLLRRDQIENERALLRFEREAHAAIGLESEHTVRTYDRGTLANGTPFLVMEWLWGIGLGTMIDRTGPLEHERAIEHALQICDAVAEAHDVGVVHRDLKAENLMICNREDGEHVIKVLDFGMSSLHRGGERMFPCR